LLPIFPRGYRVSRESDAQGF